MTRKIKTEILIASAFSAAFFVTLLLVLFADVREIGPEKTSVGLAGINLAVKNAIGFSSVWYEISDVLGYGALGIIAGMGIFALYRLVRFKKIDSDLWILGCFYVALALIYILFEICKINYRPVLIDGKIEASFPSSHTLLALFAAGSVVFQIRRRVAKYPVKIAACVFFATLGAVIIAGRILSGAHWISDIFASLMLGSALLFFYFAAVGIADSRRSEK